MAIKTITIEVVNTIALAIKTTEYTNDLRNKTKAKLKMLFMWEKIVANYETLNLTIFNKKKRSNKHSTL